MQQKIQCQIGNKSYKRQIWRHGLVTPAAFVDMDWEVQVQGLNAPCMECNVSMRNFAKSCLKIKFTVAEVITGWHDLYLAFLTA